MDTLWNDLRHGCRALLRNPGFTAVVILALALGIGANTAVFSVMNAVLFQPLPYEDPGRIVSMAGRFTGIGLPDDRNWISVPELEDVRRFSTSFSEISPWQAASYNIRFGDLPERISGAAVSANFFRLLKTDAYHGRTFAGDEDAPGRDTVVVLSHGLWQRRFQSDPNAVGRTLEISGRPFTVIGVAPPGFEFPALAEMWTPLVFTPAQMLPNTRGNHGLQVLARIKPELTLEQALADMQRTSQRIIESAPEYPYRNFNFEILIRPLLEDYVGGIRPALVMLMGAVGLVLLIACSNVANLLLVRASAREREIGVRAALGASRGRLVRQLLTESSLLALSGAILGIVLARLGVHAIVAAGGDAFPRLAQSTLDVPTLIFTLAVTMVTGLVFGVIPALQVSQSATHESLKEGGRSATTGSGHQRLRRMFVVGEVALSLALLSGAGLLIKSFIRLQQVDPGFESGGVTTMRVVVPPARYAQPEQVRAFFRDLLERAQTTPGVESAGAISALPLSGSGSSGTVTIDTTAVPPDQVNPEADLRVVTPGYMETMRMTLVSGRYFDERDSESAAPVAIIDETMARTYWPNEDVIGKRIKRGGRQSQNPWQTIVGVVRHVRYQSLESPSRVQLYAPHAQAPSAGMSLALRARGDFAGIAGAVQKATTAIDPDQPIFAVQPMDDFLADSVLRRRLVMMLLAVFAGVALVLAALGIYGVIAYWVSQRIHEIGIRLALGATRGDVLRMVVGQSLAIVLVGVCVGLAGSLLLTRFITAMLFNVTPTDPSTFALVSASLIGIGLLASFVPALRATLVDPMQTLRQE